MSNKKRNRKIPGNEPPARSAAIWKSVGCGMAMGIADIVPGVSGGTVALVLGIYQRLVNAISNLDRRFLSLLKSRDFRATANHVDLGFLLSLICGIGAGMVVAVLTVSKLLSRDDTRPFVLAIFFGLVVGSIWIVLQMIAHFRDASGVQGVTGNKSESGLARINWFALLIGAAIAGLICWMSPGGETGDLPLWYVFLSGMIAICAMILPGISGALILLLLGTYAFVVGAFKELLHFEALGINLLIVFVFGMGCLIGLLSFSKILKHLLANRYVVTMSLMCGLMIGSLMKLWPYQRDMTPGVEEFKHKVFQPELPADIDLNLLGLMMLILSSALFVLSISHLAKRFGKSSRLSET